jgi:hypothetical protein
MYRKDIANLGLRWKIAKKFKAKFTRPIIAPKRKNLPLGQGNI